MFIPRPAKRAAPYGVVSVCSVVRKVLCVVPHAGRACRIVLDSQVPRSIPLFSSRLVHGLPPVAHRDFPHSLLQEHSLSRVRERPRHPPRIASPSPHSQNYRQPSPSLCLLSPLLSLPSFSFPSFSASIQQSMAPWWRPGSLKAELLRFLGVLHTKE